MSRTLTNTVLPLFIGFLCIAHVSADEVAKLAKAATETLRAGDIDAAIKQFDDALSAGEPSSATLYNKAIAHFRKGENDVARQLFAQAGDDPKLAAKARYNLGNTDYADAVKFLEEQDANSALSKLQSAISHYKRSLAVDRSDPDARANIESAHKLIQQLQEQQKQQQDQQQQDQQDKSQQDQNQQKQDQQQSGSQDQDQESQDQNSDQSPNDTEQSEEPSKENSSQNQEQQQSDEQSEDGSEQQQPEQQQGKQEQQREQQSQQQQGEGEQNEKTSQSSEEKQSESEQQEAQSDPTKAKDSEQPEGQLKPQNASAAESETSAEEFKPGQRMTMQEARKMIQAVRDRDFRRRLEKLRKMQTRRVRVEKDW